MHLNRNIPDPIRHLSLERLNQQIENYANGYIADFAVTAEAMETRDDILLNVILKRKKAVARHPWEILMVDDTPEARLHHDALRFFYDNLGCCHALKEDAIGGVTMLIHQMMDAAAKGWAVHEITWVPVRVPAPITNNQSSMPNNQRSSHFAPPIDKGSSLPFLPSVQDGFSIPALACELTSDLRPLTSSAFAPSPNRQSAIENARPISRYSLTARLRFIPLWFFENTTARLRFTGRSGASTGETMREREWLVTAGDALMLPCARAFLFKHLPLQSWLDYCQKYGTPGIRGVTQAARDTADWTAFSNSLNGFLNDLSIVTNNTENIEVIDLKGSGEPPFAKLVERMDRIMASIWRGADLSTISRDKGYGASLQEEESRLLEMQDARMISETLNTTLDAWVIKYLFGEQAIPKAYFHLSIPARESNAQDLAIDQFLISQGIELDAVKTLERYGRTAAEKGKRGLGTGSPTSQTPRGRPEFSQGASASGKSTRYPISLGGAAEPPQFPNP